jgi:cellulose synthase/poly-beta-1,6-N-acetylglucosamine synthase-like glycosyltransferase
MSPFDTRGLADGTHLGGAPTVSVIVAAFNAESSIRDSLLSVIGQTYGDIEIIVIEDGLTDRTANIVASVAAADSGVQLIRQRNVALWVAQRCTVGVVPSVLVGYRRHTEAKSAACDAMWRAGSHVMSGVVALQPGIPSETLGRSDLREALPARP